MLSWEDIGNKHPGIYGNEEDHGEAAEGADGEGIGWAANILANDRPDDHDAEGSTAYDLMFHREKVDPRHIDYARHGMGDGRVRRAREGYALHPDKMPPPILVHRHGVFQVADGHHRSEGAAEAGRKVDAYVHYSEHEDEPFSGHDGEPPEKAPFHGATPHPGNAAHRRIQRQAKIIDSQGSLGIARPVQDSLVGAWQDRLGRLQIMGDQANAPWGAQNVSEIPPAKPYGATSPPEKDRDPGSYGPLSGPDPDNWGEIADDSAIQMPLTSDAVLHSAAPKAWFVDDDNEDDKGGDEGQWDACYHCGREHDPHEHAQDADFNPSWDRILHGTSSVHRALGIVLPEHEHAIVHDPKTRPRKAAQIIAHHIATAYPEHGHQHWSAPEGMEEVRDSFSGYAAHYKNAEGGTGLAGPRVTAVVMHAQTPDRHHVEDDSHELIDRQISPYRHPEYEIPLKRGAPVHLTGLSWRQAHQGSWSEDHRWDPGQPRKWRKHTFAEPFQITAARQAMKLIGIPHGSQVHVHRGSCRDVGNEDYFGLTYDDCHHFEAASKEEAAGHLPAGVDVKFFGCARIPKKTAQTQPEDEESFPYSDRAATAGPSTSITPRDPQGLRMEEARRRALAAFTASLNRSAVAGEPQLDGALAERKDEPEGALDPEGLTAEYDPFSLESLMDELEESRRTYHESEPVAAYKSDPADNPQKSPDKPWGKPRQATYADAEAYNLARSVPDYRSDSTTDSGRAQHPDQVTQQPGLGSMDDPYSPGDASIMTQGNQQWGGGWSDSGDLSFRPERPGAPARAGGRPGYDGPVPHDGQRR